jgi:hypothetical protein
MYEHYSSQLISGRILAMANKTRVSDALDCLLTNLEGKEAAIALIKIHRELCRIAKQNNVHKSVLESIESLHPRLTTKRINLSNTDEALADIETSLASARKKTKAKH